MTRINTPEEVLGDAVTYMKLYFGGVLFSVVYNMAAGILDQPLSEQEVLDAAAACRDKFSRLVLACLKKID